MIEFQASRKLSREAIPSLKQDYDICEFQYSMICVDWVECVAWTPSERREEVDIIELYKSIDQTKLESQFGFNLFSTFFLKYPKRQLKNQPDYPPRLPAYVCNDEYWDMSQQQLTDCLTNGTSLQLSELCDLENCDKRHSSEYHTINIRLVTTSDRVHVELLPLTGDVTNKHTHDSKLYINWYLLGRYAGCWAIASFYTKTFHEISMFAQRWENFAIGCLSKKQ